MTQSDVVAEQPEQTAKGLASFDLSMSILTTRKSADPACPCIQRPLHPPPKNSKSALAVFVDALKQSMPRFISDVVVIINVRESERLQERTPAQSGHRKVEHANDHVTINDKKLQVYDLFDGSPQRRRRDIWSTQQLRRRRDIFDETHVPSTDMTLESVRVVHERTLGSVRRQRLKQEARASDWAHRPRRR